MTKRVYSNSQELIHVYANRALDNGRCSNMTIENTNKLFSYNTIIAQWHNNTLIINTTSYSNTTSKQQGRLRYSANHINTIYVNHIGYSSQELKPSIELQKNYEAEALRLFDKASRARSRKDDYIHQAFNQLKEYQTFSALFGEKYTIKNEAELIAREKKKQAKALKARKEADKARAIAEAERIAKQAENLILWRNGNDIRDYFSVMALRIKDNTIQTSHGANIPIEHAIKAYPLLKKLHDSKKDVDLTSHSIKFGHYEMKAFANDCLIVGCHTIPFNEVSNIAKQLEL